MNYKNKIPLFASILFSLIVFVPQAHAEFVLDDFSDGAAMVTDGGNCGFSDDAASVLGGTRGIFACVESAAGIVTSETDTTLQQFIFTLSEAKGSSGLKYDSGGILLGGEHITVSGTNNALRLDFVKADVMITVTVAVADDTGKVGIFSFPFGPSTIPSSEFIPFDMIKDPVTMMVPDFTKLDHVGILLEGEDLDNQDIEVILGKVSADSSTGRPNPVGGTLIPIDTTALLVAGLENNAFSVLGALTISAVAVFGVLYYSAKRKN